MKKSAVYLDKPSWIRGRVSWDDDTREVKELLSKSGLNSVCVSAMCPNRGECWQKKHVTFMILGKNCTRKCKFCNVNKNTPDKIDLSEPEKIAGALKKLGTRYAVITSVTRDDLADKGAGQFIETVRKIKKIVPGCLVELLIPDMAADVDLLKEIAVSGADVIGHNIETPGSLYSDVRPGADYKRSLEVLSLLRRYSRDRVPIKSAMIIGLGETPEDVLRTAKDLRERGVDILYIGQYLSPTKRHWPVKKYYSPEEFLSLEEQAVDLGFKTVCAGPMVRSSYRAFEAYAAFTRCHRVGGTR